MARRRKSKANTWLWYGLYAVAGYYGYQWWQQRQLKQKIASGVVTPAQ